MGVCGALFRQSKVPAAESQVGASELLRLLGFVVRISQAGEQVNAKKRDLQRHRIREEVIEKHADQDEIGKQDERPAHIVPDDLAFAAHEFARGNSHAGSLRRDRLANF